MTTHIIIMTQLIFLVFIFASCHGNDEFYTRIRNFSVGLLKHAHSQQEDLLMSPYSVWGLMACIAVGVYGDSQKQISKAVLLPSNKTILYEGLKDLKRVLVDSTGGADIRNGNFVFMDQSFNILKEYENALLNNIDAVVQTLNFTDTEKAAVDANRIIEMHIPPLLRLMTPDDFSDTLMIMSNGLFFNGYWKFPFSVLNTEMETHYDESLNSNYYVNRMHLKANLPYLKLPSINATVLELPFGNDGKWSTLTIFPDKEVDVTYVYNRIQLVTLNAVVDTVDLDIAKNGVKEIDLKMPRFRLISEAILNEPLKKMGLYDIFESGLGSFLGIAKDDIYVGSFEHVAEIFLSEHGIRAYAKTPGSDPYKIHRGGLKAKDPFIFFVMEKPTRTMIFGGFYMHERFV